MKQFQQIITSIIAVAIAAFTPIAASANTTNYQNYVGTNSINQTFGIQGDTPPTQECPMRGQRRSFAATAIGGYMYTNCLYTGKSSYAISVHNQGSTKLSVSVIKKDGGVIYNTSVSAGWISGFTVRGLKSNDKIYIQFTPQTFVKYQFSGHIQ